MTVRIKNWDTFQHYKSGKNAAKRPEWIKLYTELLDDLEFHELDGKTAKVLVMLWMLASESGGVLPCLKKAAFRLRITEQELRTCLGRLTHWIEGSYDIPRTEEKREEREREREREERRGGANAPAANGHSNGHAWSGSIICLQDKDYAAWKRAFANLDLDAELIARDVWLSEQDADTRKRWFQSTSKYLANRNMEAKAKAQGPPRNKGSTLMDACEDSLRKSQGTTGARTQPSQSLIKDRRPEKGN